MKLTGGGMCFVCGKDNPVGLKLEFDWEEKYYTTRFKPTVHYQGYDNLVHGGIISTILDEVMGRMFFALGDQVVTAELKVRFKEMVTLDKELFFRAKKTEDKGKLIKVEAVACFEDGKIAAEAQGKFIRLGKGKSN